MKKVILSLLTILLFSGLANAQTNPPEKKMADLTSRPSDHFILQSGVDFWVGGNSDSVKTSGTGRHFNIYFMMDKPFRTNNKFSLAYGIGFGTNNQYIDKGTYVDGDSRVYRVPGISEKEHTAKIKIDYIVTDSAFNQSDFVIININFC